MAIRSDPQCIDESAAVVRRQPETTGQSVRSILPQSLWVWSWVEATRSTKARPTKHDFRFSKIGCGANDAADGLFRFLAHVIYLRSLRMCSSTDGSRHVKSEPTTLIRPD